ncbi:SLAP domain-containing protein [Lactobacillus sp. R2/2]|nr:SLAP domain-containing protein [Lactobacillus sp. R2/2]
MRKASYRYTHKGKRVSKKLLKKGSYVKINGKTYRIKGKNTTALLKIAIFAPSML